MDIYIHGHGVYQPERGFTKVPPGFKISFYTEFAKQMSWSSVNHILLEPSADHILRTVNEYMMVPDLVYVAISNYEQRKARNVAARGLNLAMFDADMTLGRIFNGFCNQMGGAI
ncbi:MAG: putative adhesin [Pseudomonadota bacterium]